MDIGKIYSTHTNQVFFSEEEWEFFEERAAIFEYEAGWSRVEAENEAFRLMMEKRINFRQAG